MEQASGAWRIFGRLSAPSVLWALAIYAAVLVPVLSVRTLPLYDYPNHLARVFVLSHLEHSTALQQFYESRWSALPNLGFELITLPLSLVLPIDVSGKIFIALTFATILGGCALLQYALHRRVEGAILISSLLLYNSIFLFGFMGYLLGVGVFLWALAAWILLRSRPPWLRLITLAPACIALLFVHLYALGLYALTVVAYEVGAPRRASGPSRATHIAVAILQLVPAALIYKFFSPTAGAASPIDFSYLLDKWHYWARITEFADVVANPAPGSMLYVHGATFAVLVLLLVIGLLSRRLELSAQMLLPIGALGLAYFLLPTKLLSGWYVGERLPVALGLVVAASVMCRLDNRRFRYAAAAVLAILVVVRSATITVTWNGYDRTYEEIRRAIDIIPQGGRLTAAIGLTGPSAVLRRPSLNHIGCYAIIQREGFFPAVFFDPRQQPMTLTPLYAQRARRDAKIVFRNDELSRRFFESHNPFDPAVLHDYDFLLVFHEELFELPPPNWLRPVFKGTEFVLYQIPSKAP